MTDITEHPTREENVYYAVVLDAFSRSVVERSIDVGPTASLATNAHAWQSISATLTDRRLFTAIREPTSWAFTRRAVNSGLLLSMGSVGDCYDCELNRAAA